MQKKTGIHRLAWALLTSTVLLAGPLSAQDAPEGSDLEEALELGMSTDFVKAYDIAMARITHDLSHEQVAEINLLAYATTAASLCADLDLNEGAIYAALVEVTHDGMSGDSELDPQTLRDFSLIAYGVMTGLLLESVVADPAEFCGEAVAYMGEMGTESFLTPASEAVLYSDE